MSGADVDDRPVGPSGPTDRSAVVTSGCPTVFECAAAVTLATVPAYGASLKVLVVAAL
ncbi:hypothetical protein ACWD5Q_29650 [Streptomyces sp. NPDC002513]